MSPPSTVPHFTFAKHQHLFCLLFVAIKNRSLQIKAHCHSADVILQRQTKVIYLQCLIFVSSCTGVTYPSRTNVYHSMFFFVPFLPFLDPTGLFLLAQSGFGGESVTLMGGTLVCGLAPVGLMWVEESKWIVGCGTLH